jgi:tetratricopeptide (TPR) repeat protein
MGAWCLVLCALVVVSRGGGTAAAQDQRSQVVSISGVQEPEEMRVEPIPFKKAEPTAAEQELAEATNNFSKIDDGTVSPALDRILAKYPEFADGYVFRLNGLCNRNDLRRAIVDVNSAIQFAGKSRVRETLASLLAMRAKLMYANGDYVGAMNALDRTISNDPEHATEFTNSGGVKPERAASVCVWTASDMDDLVQRFPTDYRSHMFRGLYYSKFAPLHDDSVKPALENLERAIKLNPKSALPQLFKAQLLSDHFVFYKRLSKLGWGDEDRNKLDAEVAREYSKAVELDPNLLPALKGRALEYLHLKEYKRAIADYDRILSLDAQDATSMHDRGLAKMLLGRNYEAISDFSAYINFKLKSTSIESRSDAAHGYESRGDAYVKTRQWDRAIRDFTMAISYQVGNSLLLMNMDQFRALYPEYKRVSNEAVMRKLHQTFYPNFKYDDFSNEFLSRAPMPSTVIPDLYLKRADAYVGRGNWHGASIEFRRAANGFPTYADALDRWREIGATRSARTYVDLKTFDDKRHDSVTVWIKQSSGPDEAATGPYALKRFELNCPASQIRLVSFANYDGSGQVVGSGQGGRWDSVIPDTFGETVYNGACRGS